MSDEPRNYDIEELGNLLKKYLSESRMTHHDISKKLYYLYA
jgi:hypothetical protein